MKENKKEIVRDFLALGSWVFYVLVIGRALIKPYRPFADQVIITGVLIFIIGIFIKNWDEYVARGLTLAFFTILFYEDSVFTIFAIAVSLGLIFSSYYLEKSWRKIILGIIVGVIASATGYYVSGLY